MLYCTTFVKKSSNFIHQKKGHKWREASVKIENSFFEQ